MVTVWFLGIMVNGIAFVSMVPFSSEEDCLLAAKIADVQIFDCLPREVPAEQLEPDGSEPEGQDG